MSSETGEMPTTITEDDLAVLYLDACPSFEAVWAGAAETAVHLDEAGDRLHYLDAGAFVRHLAHLEADGQRGDFPAVFQLIEQLITSGSPYVQELAVIGILECLQGATITDLGIDPELAFRPLLRPITEHWWDRINRFWDGDTTALQNHS